MKKIKNQILKINLILLVCFQILQADKIDLTLRQFANLVADENHINILISSKIQQDKVIFFLADKSKYVMLPAFKTMLKSKNLILLRKNGFFFIDKIVDPLEKVSLHSIKLNNLVSDSVLSLLKLYKIDGVYVKSTNSVDFLSSKKDYLAISKIAKKFDKKLPQVQFKINIFYTNLDNLKDKGFNLSAYMQSVHQQQDGNTPTLPYTYFLNLITMPYNATSNIVANSKKGLYATIKYLTQNHYTDILNSPTLTARSHSKVSFSSVKNVPYLVSTVKNENTSTQITQNIVYKDVGLKINISPVVLGDYVNFDLNLIVEDLISHTQTPTTEKRELNSSYTLKRGDVLVLSGVNKTVNVKNEYGVPILKNIFIIGNLFKYTSYSKTKSVLTITIEVD